MSGMKDLLSGKHRVSKSRKLGKYVLIFVKIHTLFELAIFHSTSYGNPFITAGIGDTHCF